MHGQDKLLYIIIELIWKAVGTGGYIQLLQII